MAYSLSLSSFLLWSRIWVKGKSRDTRILGFFHNLLLRCLGSDDILFGRLDSALLLELALLQGRHVGG